ncbi:glycosyltransferase family 4 protein [Halorubrum sp. BOL3-1]|uniref:glycosyltransferase family 4 protein n=1 Tax=Halorubrum sp. BOL3-1 TaxID=2497325 RepID=UPI0014091F10|nr:glycosyltransferase family 4 protein [Halorubrum sp. BOL3-1]
MSDLRVLHVFSDPRFGGPGTRTISIGKALRSRGIISEFLVPDGPGELATKAREEGFDVYETTLPRPRSPPGIVENVRYLSSFPRTVARVADQIQRSSCDIVHLNTPYNFSPALAAHRNNHKFIWHFNDTLTPWPLRPLASRFARRWADKIAVSSPRVDEYFGFESSETTTLYPPVDGERFDPESVKIDPENDLRKTIDNSTENSLFVGAVGNVNPAKGYEHLLRALPPVVDSFNDIIVPIVGSILDSHQSYYTRLLDIRSRLGLEDHVNFLGFQENIPEILAQLDIFVMPSVAESGPLVTVEAMAMEKPVIATSVGNVPAQIPSSDYGWVVPPGDSEQLSQAIKEALSSPSDRLQRGKKGRERTIEQFSVEACAESYENIYRENTL